MPTNPPGLTSEALARRLPFPVSPSQLTWLAKRGRLAGVKGANGRWTFNRVVAVAQAKTLRKEGRL